MQKVAFIINPASGIGRKILLEKRLNRFFHAQNGWEATIYHTTCADDAFEAAQNYKEQQFDLVVAVGGDGTVNKVAHALVHSSVPMGIIPTGSGNGLARHLKIPLSVKKAIEVILKGKVTTIDSGEINGQPFFCTAGIGFDANLAHRFNRAPVRGFPSYLALSALEYIHYQPDRYSICIGDTKIEREAFLITFANCAQWGNNVYIAPDASATDGLLDMVIWKKSPIIDIPLIATRLIMKNIDHSHKIEIIKGAFFRIMRLYEGLVHFDGEPVQMGRELNVAVYPGSLQVVTPCSYQ